MIDDRIELGVPGLAECDRWTNLGALWADIYLLCFPLDVISLGLTGSG